MSSLVNEMEESPRPASCPSQLSGQPSMGWVLDQVSRSGMGSFVHRHHRWVAESGVRQNSPAVHEHEVLSLVLDAAIFVDRLNLKNLECFELAGRRLQLQESAIAENPESPSYEGAQHFLGIREKRGGALVAPQLTAY
eukprot:10149478-Karenia_brevis.AAC.1